VDPDTGVPDPFAGAVYVGFSTDYTAPTGATNFNPNSIKLMASLDGGLNFTTQAFVNNNRHLGPQRDTAPRLVVSQGSTSGATPGQVSIVYDDFGSLSTATPPRSTIRMNRVRDGGMGVFVQSPIMNDTTGHIHHQPDMTTPPTDFSLPVSFDANPDFGGLTDLNVTVNITYTSLANLTLALISPSGVSVSLMATMTTSGTVLGQAQAPNGMRIGTTFDDAAPRSLTAGNGATAPYIGHYRPASPLGLAFGGMNQDSVNGTWTLRVTTTDTTDAAMRFVFNWAVNFTFGLTPQFTSDAATQVKVLGAGVTTLTQGSLTFPYPARPDVSPDVGIGPHPVIASDNTLGAFSPTQGRLYIAYVGRLTGGGNPT